MIRVLSAADVKEALPMAEAIAGMKTAFAQLARGGAVVPLRGHMDVAGQGVTLTMPAYLRESQALAVKVVSVFPGNVQQNMPTIHAAVLVLAANTGKPLALLEGSTLTAIRTGAGAGAATDVLARPEANTVAIIGSGVQARTQLEAVCTVRRIERVYVYSLTRANALAFAEEMAGLGPIPAAIEVMDSAETAVAQADIICTATTATTPVFKGHALQPGTHINGVGSFTPHMQELDLETVQRSLVVVDSLEAALAEAGELIAPLLARQIEQSHIERELGQILAGQKLGRTSPDQITFFKSVGNAIQDAIAGSIALSNANQQQLGVMVPF